MTNSLTDELKSATSARLIGVFPSGSASWHEIRATGVGGSDVGAILGLNKWESPLSLWGKRTGLVDNLVEESEAMEWGRLLESVVLDKFERQHPELEVLRDVGTWHHPERPWQLANPDALARDRKTGEWIVIEVKTARYEDEWDDKTATVPPSYRAQTLWYLDTFGFKKAIVAALFSGSKYREFIQETDPLEADANRQAVARWWDHVQVNKQPDYDGAEATYETIRALNPYIEDGEVELGDLGVHYFNATTELERAEAKQRELKSRVLDAMGKAKRGLIEGNWVLTRQARGSGLPYLVMKK